MTPEAVERRLITLAMLGRLTDAHLDGQACLWCGNDTEPMAPIYTSSSQLFACVRHGEENGFPERMTR